MCPSKAASCSGDPQPKARSRSSPLRSSRLNTLALQRTKLRDVSQLVPLPQRLPQVCSCLLPITRGKTSIRPVNRSAQDFPLSGGLQCVEVSTTLRNVVSCASHACFDSIADFHRPSSKYRAVGFGEQSPRRWNAWRLVSSAKPIFSIS